MTEPTVTDPTPTPPAKPTGIPLWFTLVGLVASFVAASVFHTHIPIIVGGFIVLGLLLAGIGILWVVMTVLARLFGWKTT
jgi:hypothetical protein